MRVFDRKIRAVISNKTISYAIDNAQFVIGDCGRYSKFLQKPVPTSLARGKQKFYRNVQN